MVALRLPAHMEARRSYTTAPQPPKTDFGHILQAAGLTELQSRRLVEGTTEGERGQYTKLKFTEH